MKALVLLLTTTFFLTSEFDLRKLKWGMTIDEVLESETLKVDAKVGGQLKYSAVIDNIDFTLLYTFKDGRLYKAVYTCKETYVNKNDYITDFNNLKGKLEKKYGTPKSTGLAWKGEKYKANEADWGKAVSEGQLDYHTRWQNDRSTIDLKLTGSSFKCQMDITYEARNTKWNQPTNDSTDDF